jgi:hypothetical protein
MWRAAECSKTTSSNEHTPIPQLLSCCKVFVAGKACGKPGAGQEAGDDRRGRRRPCLPRQPLWGTMTGETLYIDGGYHILG